MKIHPYAQFFPPIVGSEFNALVASIKKFGLRKENPICLYEGKILDGRNRYRACVKAGVKPHYREFANNGMSPLQYVIKENVRRRHLSASQLGVIAQDMLPEFEKEAAERSNAARKRGGAPRGLPVLDKGRAAEHAGKVLGISRHTVARVKRVTKEAPDLLPKIRSGALSAKAADYEVRLRAANEGVKRNNARKDKKARQENPREVKAYLDACQAFYNAAVTAKKVAEFGKFSPEAGRFTVRLHDKIRERLTKIEEVFDA